MSLWATREEAVAEAARANRDDPERDRYGWIVQEESPGQWRVLRVRGFQDRVRLPMKRVERKSPFGIGGGGSVGAG